MTRWYYAVGADQKGPVGEEELRALIKDGKVGDKTRLWKKGMESWDFADEIRELDPVFDRLPPLPPELAVPLQTENPAYGVAPGGELRSSLARPWPRFWARFIDTTLLIMPTAFAIGYMKAYWDLRFQFGSPETHGLIMTTLLLPIIYMLLALMMTATGSTIGKTVMAVKVPVPQGRSRLGFYLTRELKVWMAGIGFGIPIVALFTQIRQYRLVAAGKPASYDKGHTSVVRRASKLRVILGASIVVGLLGFGVYLEMKAQEAAAELAPTQLWTNPINSRTAYIAKTWTSREVNVGGSRAFMFESDTQRATIVFGYESYEFDGVENRDYAEAIQAAISRGITITSDWSPVTVQGHPGLRATGKSVEYEGIEIELTVAVIGRNAWRIMVSANGRPASQVPNWDELVQALFSTAD